MLGEKEAKKMEDEDPCQREAMVGHWGGESPDRGQEVRQESGSWCLRADRKGSVALPTMDAFCSFMLFFWI